MLTIFLVFLVYHIQLFHTGLEQGERLFRMLKHLPEYFSEQLRKIKLALGRQDKGGIRTKGTVTLEEKLLRWMEIPLFIFSCSGLILWKR